MKYSVEILEENEWHKVYLEMCRPERRCGLLGPDCCQGNECLNMFFGTENKSLAETIAQGREVLGYTTRIVEVE